MKSKAKAMTAVLRSLAARRGQDGGYPAESPAATGTGQVPGIRIIPLRDGQGPSEAGRDHVARAGYPMTCRRTQHGWTCSA